MSRLSASVLTFAFVAASIALTAAVPAKMNYQGRLTLPGAGPVPDSTGNTLVFRIFDAATLGAVVRGWRGLRGEGSALTWISKKYGMSNARPPRELYLPSSTLKSPLVVVTQLVPLFQVSVQRGDPPEDAAYKEKTIS
jgi:hypothetical protein